LRPPLHLSVQAGDDIILKRMKRRHSRAEVVRLCARLRALRPEIALGADLIAGFPTETDAMFERTLDLIDEAGLTYLHVFPFSARHGTPAARMPQVPKTLRHERAARLRAAGQHAMARFLERQIGRPAQVLVERGARGRCEKFAPFRIEPDGAAPVAGEIVTARAVRVEDGVLVGQLVA
jgi:threonylcarbamoyladenosine tRNA methylthiotransferase MtaB